MEKNQVFQVEAIGYGEDGYAICKYDGFTLFVPGLILGEVANVAITKLQKHYGYARIVEILQPSKHRISPKCSVYKQCGGCHLQHMDAFAMGQMKEIRINDCFKNIAQMDVEINPIIQHEPLWNYRNKVLVPVQLDQGIVKMGFYYPRTNRIVEFSYCDVQSEQSNQIVQTIKKHLERYKGANQIRHVLIKHAQHSGQIMVGLVVRHYPFQNSEKLVETLVSQFKEIQSIVAIVNHRLDNVILDGKEILIYGKNYIVEQLLDCQFRISAQSFFQVNPFTTKDLYQTAISYANLSPSDVLVDMYCGTGTMGIIAAKHCKKVYGIEIVEKAIIDAKKNARMNGVENVEFICGDALYGAKRLIESRIKVDAMLIDPPRKGCTKDTLDAIIRIHPIRLVYVSCDPATLARDVRILVDEGYQIEQVQPFDLICQTSHVETIVLLVKTKEN